MIQGGEAGRLIPLAFCSGLSSGSSAGNTVVCGRSRILALFSRSTETYLGVSGRTIICSHSLLGVQQDPRVCDNRCFGPSFVRVSLRGLLVTHPLMLKTSFPLNANVVLFSHPPFFSPPLQPLLIIWPRT